MMNYNTHQPQECIYVNVVWDCGTYTVRFLYSGNEVTPKTKMVAKNVFDELTTIGYKCTIISDDNNEFGGDEKYAVLLKREHYIPQTDIDNIFGTLGFVRIHYRIEDAIQTYYYTRPVNKLSYIGYDGVRI